MTTIFTYRDIEKENSERVLKNLVFNGNGVQIYCLTRIASNEVMYTVVSGRTATNAATILPFPTFKEAAQHAAAVQTPTILH